MIGKLFKNSLGSLTNMIYTILIVSIAMGSSFLYGKYKGNKKASNTYKNTITNLTSNLTQCDIERRNLYEISNEIPNLSEEEIDQELYGTKNINVRSMDSASDNRYADSINGSCILYETSDPENFCRELHKSETRSYEESSNLQIQKKTFGRQKNKRTNLPAFTKEELNFIINELGEYK